LGVDKLIESIQRRQQSCFGLNTILSGQGRGNTGREKLLVVASGSLQRAGQIEQEGFFRSLHTRFGTWL
jgi:hypothetical protein